MTAWRASDFLRDKMRDLGSKNSEFDNLYLQLVPGRIVLLLYYRTNMAGPIIRVDWNPFQNLAYSQFEKIHCALPEEKSRYLNFNVMLKILLCLLLFSLRLSSVFQTFSLEFTHTHTKSICGGEGAVNEYNRKSILSFRCILLRCKWQAGSNEKNTESESHTIYLKILAILSVFSGMLDFK